MHPQDSPNLPDPSAAFDADTLAPRELRVVLVCDVVESVRWMEHDEDYAVSRWQAFTQHVRSTIVPAHGGSVVKSTGDGMMVEFTNARSAVQAATALQAKASEGNATQAPERHLQLRTGIHETHARRDAHDLYGHGVNLAARITTLAGPGEIIVSAPVRDHLTDVLDGDIEDMGECYLKHIVEPQRVYRVGAAGSEPILVPQREYADCLLPTIAVIPFEARSNAPEHFAIGELIADGVIASLGRNASIKVMSRLSTNSMRGHHNFIENVFKKIRTNFIVMGSYINHAEKLVVFSQLINCNDDTVMWAEKYTCTVENLFEERSAIFEKITSAANEKINFLSRQITTEKPLPNLASYELMNGGLTLMHRSSSHDLEKSRAIFSHLIDRHPTYASPHAWLAKTYVLNAVSRYGVAENNAKLAFSHCESALRCAPNDALSLAIEGHVYTHLDKNPSKAKEYLAAAIVENPNEPLAWLFNSVWSSMWGNSQAAVTQARHAKSLSPWDPMAYYFDMIEAAACTSNADYDSAIELAQRSLRHNKHHSPTWRVLLVAQSMSGQHVQAHTSWQKILHLDPGFSLNAYQEAGNADSRTKQHFATALKEIGLLN
jgi:adenylate cyclase